MFLGFEFPHESRSKNHDKLLLELNHKGDLLATGVISGELSNERLKFKDSLSYLHGDEYYCTLSNYCGTLGNLSSLGW